MTFCQHWIKFPSWPIQYSTTYLFSTSFTIKSALHGPSIVPIVLKQWLADLLSGNSNILMTKNVTLCICKHYLLHEGMYFLLNTYIWICCFFCHGTDLILMQKNVAEKWFFQWLIWLSVQHFFSTETIWNAHWYKLVGFLNSTYLFSWK